jgi:hypothetical protein
MRAGPDRPGRASPESREQPRGARCPPHVEHLRPDQEQLSAEHLSARPRFRSG